MYARPQIGGEVVSFGVSGMLWREALVMYDRQSRSLWSQRAHRAIAGPHTGLELEVLSTQVTDWRSWLREHPETTVLIKPKEGLLLRLADGGGTVGLWVAITLLISLAISPPLIYLLFRNRSFMIRSARVRTRHLP